MPTSPSPAQRVARALQEAHARAEADRDRATSYLQEATEQHARAIARLYEAHAEERALAAALAEHGAPTWQQEQETRRLAAEAEERAQQVRERVDRLKAQAGAGTAEDAGPHGTHENGAPCPCKPAPVDKNAPALVEAARDLQAEGGRRDLQAGPVDPPRPAGHNPVA